MSRNLEFSGNMVSPSEIPFRMFDIPPWYTTLLRRLDSSIQVWREWGGGGGGGGWHPMVSDIRKKVKKSAVSKDDCEKTIFGFHPS